MSGEPLNVQTMVCRLVVFLYARSAKVKRKHADLVPTRHILSWRGNALQTKECVRVRVRACVCVCGPQRGHGTEKGCPRNESARFTGFVSSREVRRGVQSQGTSADKCTVEQCDRDRGGEI